MPPPSKKFKSSVIAELSQFQNEIKKIKGEIAEKEIADLQDSNEVTKEPVQSEPTINLDQLKSIIKNEIQLSERRILDRIEKVEESLSRLIAERSQSDKSEVEEEVLEVEEEPIVEYLEPEIDSDSFTRLFPIADEQTFDHFFENLKEEDYRTSLINQRWTLTKTVNTKSFNVAVKEFLRLHFDLTVCVLYSCSGYGSHGRKKKKLDTKSLNSYVYECFNLEYPGVYSQSDVSKAIGQFWGRVPDTLHKLSERMIKREISQ